MYPLDTLIISHTLLLFLAEIDFNANLIASLE